MVSQQEQEKALIRNLEDAGCPPNMIEVFIECQKDEKYAEQQRLLLKQRRLLLEEVHDTQHRLECLDYLIYIIRKKEKENTP